MQRHTHIKSLKMTLKEVKDEFKQTEGSPEVKAKIRRMQMQQAAEGGRQREALDNVASATTVITNPTHFAVALKYEAGEAGAPTVVAMGKGKMAERIIERANDAKVGCCAFRCSHVRSISPVIWVRKFPRTV